MARKMPAGDRDPRDERVYSLKVLLIGGPVTKDFLRANPEVSRTVEVLGSQTLEDLHEAIFKALDRFDEHMYQFELGGWRPHDPKAARYSLPSEGGGLFGEDDAADATQVRIDSLGLRSRQVFFYWSDFGDDRWHKISVKGVGQPAPGAKYPRVTAAVGKSPPQYPGMDDEEEEEEDGEGAEEDSE